MSDYSDSDSESSSYPFPPPKRRLLTADGAAALANRSYSLDGIDTLLWAKSGLSPQQSVDWVFGENRREIRENPLPEAKVQLQSRWHH